MRGVLVDDDEAVAGLRDDVGLVHLRARGAERALDADRARPRPASTRASADGAPTSKAACAASAKPTRAAARDAAKPAEPAGRAGERRQSQAPPRCAETAGRNAAMVASPPVVAARWPSRASASCSAPTISPRTSAGIAEAHLGLGRMHVDVDLARIERQEQRHAPDGGRAADSRHRRRAPRRAAACRAPAGR